MGMMIILGIVLCLLVGGVMGHFEAKRRESKWFIRILINLAAFIVAPSIFGVEFFFLKPHWLEMGIGMFFAVIGGAIVASTEKSLASRQSDN